MSNMHTKLNTLFKEEPTFQTNVRMVIDPFTGEDSDELDRILREDEVEFTINKEKLEDLSQCYRFAVIHDQDSSRFTTALAVDSPILDSFKEANTKHSASEAAVAFGSELVASIEATTLGDLAKAELLFDGLAKTSGITDTDRKCLSFHDLVSLLNTASTCFSIYGDGPGGLLTEPLLNLLDGGPSAVRKLVSVANPKDNGYVSPEKMAAVLVSAARQLMDGAKTSYSSYKELIATREQESQTPQTMMDTVRRGMRLRYGMYFTKCAIAATIAVCE